jgi:hypothetical protein
MYKAIIMPLELWSTGITKAFYWIPAFTGMTDLSPELPKLFTGCPRIKYGAGLSSPA